MDEMKDLKELIENGILELYLTGDLSRSEEQELESVIKRSPDVRDYFLKLEEALEAMAIENKVVPPPAVKKNIMAAIDDGPQVIPISTKKSFNPLIGIAASFALLFGISSFWLYTKVNTLEEEIKVVQNEKGSLENKLLEVESNLAEVENVYDLIKNPKTEKYILKGNANSPNAIAVSYVNHESKTVLLDAKGLPQLADEHDYQLWADVDGVMINMGVIPDATDMVAMTYIDDAESLNITIEPAGGSDHPTVERLITNIYIQP
jgi:anti-sigma-K factor RskA